MFVTVIRRGESVKIGDVVKMTLDDVNTDNKTVSLTFQFPTLSIDTVLAEDGFFHVTNTTISVKLMTCKVKKATFGIAAPQSIKIQKITESKGGRQDVEKPKPFQEA